MRSVNSRLSQRASETLLAVQGTRNGIAVRRKLQPHYFSARLTLLRASGRVHYKCGCKDAKGLRLAGLPDRLLCQPVRVCEIALSHMI